MNAKTSRRQTLNAPHESRERSGSTRRPAPQLKRLPLALVTAAGLSLGLSGTAVQAAAIVVNDSGDTASESVCILRDAIRFMRDGAISGSTNCTNSGDDFGIADVITFDSSISTISLTNSNPLLYGVNSDTQALTIQGTGQGGITITRPSPNGGLLRQYGGDLTLDGITLSGGRNSFGGAVSLDVASTSFATKLQLTNSVVTGNSAIGGGAGAGIYVPAANVSATIIITNSTISNNNQAYGGSINGAGIYLGGASTLEITGSTLSGNGSAGNVSQGGAIWAGAGANITLTNTTISGNQVTCGGAGVHVSNVGNVATSVTITNSTITYNFSTSACTGAGLYQYGGNITLNNSLMAGNFANGSTSDIAASSFVGLTVNGTNNLVRNVSSSVTFTSPRLTSDPLLGPLQNNGGPTLTRALGVGSPAIDAGGATLLSTDQRGSGYPRVSGAAADIGAFEFIVPINGACGSASNSTPVFNPPATNLCSTGTATMVSGPQPFTWGCNGSDGGTSTSATACSVPIQTWSVSALVDSGPASGTVSPATPVVVNHNYPTTFTLTPASGYVLSAVAGCGGSGSVSPFVTPQITADCNVVATFSLIPAEGSCGTANGVTATAAPTANLCSSGIASSVTGSGPWAWTCTGTTTASCAAPIQQVTAAATVNGGNGSISPPSQTVNYNTATSFALTPSPGYQIGQVQGCSGTLAGNVYTTGTLVANCAVTATFTLVPVNGSCGSANGVVATSAPTTNLCATGNTTGATGSGPWAWTCTPNATGTVTANCAAPIQQVTATATVNGGNGSISPPSQTTNYNTATSFTLTPSAGYQIGQVQGCSGTLVGNLYTTGTLLANCAVTATFTLGAVNGACGSASSATPALIAPSSNLCSTGTATAVAGTGPWTWGCNGNATGTSTTATACSVPIKTWAVTPSVNGGNGSITPNTVVTVNNNAVTSFAITPNSGYNIVSVIGCNGTLSGTTFNTAAILADCGVVASFSAVPRAQLVFTGNTVPISNGDSTPATADGTDFGAVMVGQSATHAFGISNPGTATLTITAMSFSGANASDFVITSPTLFPVTVVAGGSTNFSVRFTPSAAGPRSASLLITTNDGAGAAAIESVHAKAILNGGFAVQGVGVAADPGLPVPTWGLGGLLVSALGLLLAGFGGLRRSGKR